MVEKVDVRKYAFENNVSLSTHARAQWAVWREREREKERERERER